MRITNTSLLRRFMARPESAITLYTAFDHVPLGEQDLLYSAESSTILERILQIQWGG